MGDTPISLLNVSSETANISYNGNFHTLSKNRQQSLSPGVEIVYKYKKGTGASIGISALDKSIWRDKHR